MPYNCSKWSLTLEVKLMFVSDLLKKIHLQCKQIPFPLKRRNKLYLYITPHISFYKKESRTHTLASQVFPCKKTTDRAKVNKSELAGR